MEGAEVRLMADFPNPIDPHWNVGGVFSTAGSLLGITNTNPASTAFPSANLAVFVPIRIPQQKTVYKLVVGAGSTAAGNFDVGIYDAGGNKLVSSGATAKGASVEHVIDITDTVIGPGLYYLALAADGTNNYIAALTSVSAQFSRLAGVVQADTSYPLPATVTFAAAANAYAPVIAAYTRGV